MAKAVLLALIVSGCSYTSVSLQPLYIPYSASDQITSKMDGVMLNIKYKEKECKK